MSVATFTATGTKATTNAKLDSGIFDVEVANHELLKTAYLADLANARQSSAVTKTRGLIRGGGRKPWKQKGTGRARFGSTRNPIWRGGGIVFGPTGNENYSIKLHTKARRKAIRQALSLAMKENRVIVIEKLSFKEAKTSAAASLLKKIGAQRKVLIAVEVRSPELTRSFNNLLNTRVVRADYLGVSDILDADTIVFTNDSLSLLSTWLGGETK